MGYIYLITNHINGKKYVGQTVNPIHHRWKEHIEDSYNGNKSNSLLHRAIIRDGESNFGIEMIEECSNELLNDREKMYIQVYDTFYTHERGYNMTWGGEGHTTYSDEEIIYLWNQGYRNCEIARLLGAKDTTISLRIQSLVGNGAAQTRRADSRKISIIQYDLQGNYIKDWESASIAEKELNLSQGSISRCCNK
jgi:group I intron endonuclease